MIRIFTVSLLFVLGIVCYAQDSKYSLEIINFHCDSLPIKINDNIIVEKGKCIRFNLGTHIHFSGKNDWIRAKVLKNFKVGNEDYIMDRQITIDAEVDKSVITPFMTLKKVLATMGGETQMCEAYYIDMENDTVLISCFNDTTQTYKLRVDGKNIPAKQYKDRKSFFFTKKDFENHGLINKDGNVKNDKAYEIRNKNNLVVIDQLNIIPLEIIAEEQKQ